ncbi:MAG: hypothetical protein KIT84_28120 [Labilithrix sp.]|nr:hypothetical protein [Labilithrix sp.]MCW5814925.1 hypothetical protein [Labilithrix sp.]
MKKLVWALCLVACSSSKVSGEAPLEEVEDGGAARADGGGTGATERMFIEEFEGDLSQWSAPVLSGVEGKSVPTLAIDTTVATTGKGALFVQLAPPATFGTRGYVERSFEKDAARLGEGIKCKLYLRPEVDLGSNGHALVSYVANGGTPYRVSLDLRQNGSSSLHEEFQAGADVSGPRLEKEEWTLVQLELVLGAGGVFAVRSGGVLYTLPLEKLPSDVKSWSLRLGVVSSGFLDEGDNTLAVRFDALACDPL